jgi:serine/threonine protein kinase
LTFASVQEARADHFGETAGSDTGDQLKDDFMVRITEEVMVSNNGTRPNLREAISRYRRSRRSLAQVLIKIDEEVERLELQHKLRTNNNGRAPILRVDLDVCPGPIGKRGPSYYGTARTQQAPPRWKSNSVDETLMMAHILGDGSADLVEPTPQFPSGSVDVPDPSSGDGQDSNGLLATGAVLGDRYELIKCVGTGGSSAVYKALDRRRMTFDDVSPFVAVKVLKARFSAMPDWLESMRREAATSQLLTHPNVIRVYDTLREGSTVCLIMEYLSGAPLTDKIRTEKSTRLPKNFALKIIEAMGRALAYAHKRGVVHCDFKPANIFLLQDDSIKLIDFGIAQLLRAPESGVAADADALGTLRDLHPVTPAYASPELLERHDPDPRDDVYSLGCTAYELLTGVHPFDFRSAIEARRLDLKVERRDGLTRQQWKALAHALALQRSQRTPTVARFMSDLYGWTWQAQLLSRAAGARMITQGLAWLGNHQRKSIDPAQTTATTIATSAERLAAGRVNALPPPDNVSPPRPGPGIDPADS